jgi:hypothetical protein
VEPQVVDVNGLLVLELVGPLATMLVLRVLPLGSDAMLEEMVIRLDGKIGSWGDVVLVQMSATRIDIIGNKGTYVDAPKLLDRVK